MRSPQARRLFSLKSILLLAVLIAGSMGLTHFSGNYLPAPVSKNRQLKRHFASIRTVDVSSFEICPFLSPAPDAPGVSSPFGMRFHPILLEDRFHTGIDFPLEEGFPIIAAADGVVINLFSETDSVGYGKAILLAHDETYSSLYAHLSVIFVRPDQVVSAGDTIGLSGNSGRSTNPHLHFEVHKNGEAVDPLGFLPPLHIFDPAPIDSLTLDSLRQALHIHL
jgi:murein DD-endopeptidase MepM/ murein hydrolase activator NlpD